MAAQSGQLSDLRSRLFFLLGALIVFRIGAHVPVAGVDYEALQAVVGGGYGGVLGLLNLFSGGALERASVMALGVFPYITASIIMMLGSYSLPFLEELRKEGESGRKKINQYTRIFTVPLSLFQAYGFSIGLEALGVVENPGASFRVPAMIGMMGGSIFLMWVGEQITERGIGNGMSLLIFASIVSSLPAALGQMFELARLGVYGPFTVIFFVLFITGTLGVVVFIERGQRRVLINYARRQMGGRTVGGQASYLPLKVNMGGVMPAIFAYAIITFPTTILALSASGGSVWLRDLSAYLQQGTPLYFLLLGGTIFFFAFFFVSLVYNPRENSDMLRKGGAFIPGIRPGEQTANHLEKIVSRLTLAGACYITTICVVPEMLFSQPYGAAIFGGTSILIMVVVSMDFMEQVQHYLMTRQYGSLVKNMPGGRP
ncbi:MAG: preprotein translocase subunit SecY [Gammaproteobacteria bacterium]